MTKLNLTARLVVTFSALSIGFTSPAFAQNMDASNLLIACGTPDESWISFCNGYVQAVYDAANLERAEICPPPGTTRAQMASHVYSGLSALSAGTGGQGMGELSGAAATILILSARYPCE